MSAKRGFTVHTKALLSELKERYLFHRELFLCVMYHVYMFIAEGDSSYTYCNSSIL